MAPNYNQAKFINLRQNLHRYPETSGKEYKTAKVIKRVMLSYQPDRFVEGLGGTGIAAIFNGKETGPSVMFRCDMDALPIMETNQFAYKSAYQGVAHKCGHDGHMAIMLGLAEAVYNNPPRKGRLILLFQPSEEDGQGALRVLNDEKFKAIEPDFIYALHNLPGYEKGSIILREGPFAAASKGMINRLTGKTAHAGEPENGISPALAMADIVKDLTFLPQNSSFGDFSLVTIIHTRLGEIAFGTTPGYAEVMATLRTYSNTAMEALTTEALRLVDYHALKNKLKTETDWTEEFPATVNNRDAVKIVEKAAKELDLPTVYLEEPFRWSEDFSNFTLSYPGALFGLGAGEHHPQLHNPDYDFPDEILPRGIELFFGIYWHYLK